MFITSAFDFYDYFQLSLKNMTDPLMDELDWPQLGFSTGFMNTTSPYLIEVFIVFTTCVILC